LAQQHRQNGLSHQSVHSTYEVISLDEFIILEAHGLATEQINLSLTAEVFEIQFQNARLTY